MKVPGGGEDSRFLETSEAVISAEQTSPTLEVGGRCCVNLLTVML